MYKKKIINFLLIITFIISSTIVYINMQQYEWLEELKLRDKSVEKSYQLFSELSDMAMSHPDKIIKDLTLRLDKEDNGINAGIYEEIIGRAYVRKYDKENSNKHLNNALKIYENCEQAEKFEFKLNIFLINLYMLEGDYAKSAYHCSKLLDIIDNREAKYISENDIAEAKSLISVMSLKNFLEAKFKEKANIYYEEIEEISTDENIYSKHKDILLYSKYLYEMEVENYSKANSTIEELNDLSNKNEIKSEFICKEAIRLGLIRSKIKMGDKSEVIYELESIMKKFESVSNYYYLGMCYLTYGDYFKILEEYDEAKLNYEKAIKCFEDIEYGRGIIKVCENIIKMHENKNEFTNINEFYTKYFRYSYDSEENDALKLLITDLGSVNKALGRIKTKNLKEEKIYIENKNNEMKKIELSLLIIIISMVFIVYKLHNQVLRRIKKEEQLKKSLNIDYLTQSYTKAHGYEKIEQLIEEKKDFYLAIVDLDNFKRINDTYGHIFGDTVLSNIALNIRRSLDEEDFLVRFGGEEFIIVITNKSFEDVKEKLEEIRSNIETIDWENGLKTTVSIGIAKYKNGDLTSFLDKVDGLLYVAKNTGKNRVEVGL